MSPLRLTGSTSGYSQIDAPAVAGDQTFTLPGTGGTLDRLNRAGNVLQVVNATTSTELSNILGTYLDTGLTATITPTASSSKVLVFINQCGIYKSVTNTWLTLRLLRASTSILDIEGMGAYTNDTTRNGIGSISTSYLDSPSTTSSVTYKTQFRSGDTSTAVSVQSLAGAGFPSTSTITLMEIAA